MNFLKVRVKKCRRSSYSQCGEDLIIRFIFDQLQIMRPSYIDVGAHHPFYLSNTALFYENGSSGINIEPDPNLFQRFLRYRKNDVNLNVGIGNANGEADFYIISAPTLNTFSKQDAENYKNEGNYTIKQVIKMPVLSIAHVVDNYFGGIFPQFFNLDAEGVDEMIVRSIDFLNNFPLVLCVETISFSTSGRGVKNRDIIDYICSQGYLNYADTYINTIFVREDAFRKHT